MANLGPMLPASSLQIELIDSGWLHSIPENIYHTKTIPMAIIAAPLKGHYEFSTPEATVVASVGEYAIIPPNTPLRIGEFAPPGGYFEAHWLHIRASVHQVIDLTSLLTLPFVLRGDAARQCRSLIEDCTQLEHRPPDSIQDAIRWNAYAYRALDILFNSIPPREEGYELIRRTRRIAPLLAFIRTHLHEEMSIERIADAAALSEPRLFAVFREILGVSPMQYVKEARLKHAAHALLGTGLPVGDIAAQHGFKNPFHFSREFRVRFGITPAAYRKQRIHG